MKWYYFETAENKVIFNVKYCFSADDFECHCPEFWNGKNCHIFDLGFTGGIGSDVTRSSSTEVPLEEQVSRCEELNCDEKSYNGQCDVRGIEIAQYRKSLRRLFHKLVLFFSRSNATLSRATTTVANAASTRDPSRTAPPSARASPATVSTRTVSVTRIVQAKSVFSTDSIAKPNNRSVTTSVATADDTTPTVIVILVSYDVMKNAAAVLCEEFRLTSCVWVPFTQVATRTSAVGTEATALRSKIAASQWAPSSSS